MWLLFLSSIVISLIVATRYPSIRTLDYCFHPIHIVDDFKDVYVPCGRCDGCLLHKANEWSQRVGTELEYSPNSIFFTLTYSNKFIPSLIKYDPIFDFHGDLISHFPFWYSDHLNSYRFDGKNIVRRHDNIVLKDFGYESIPLKNSDFNCINYFSKRDLQLWLKLLRSSIIKHFKNIGIYDKRTAKDGFFRYYIISEVGPTTYRSHGHGIIFCKSHEVSEYLLERGLYENWQMCDKSRFDDFAHYCDSGARGYVTQYLTSTSDLPRVYTENKEVKPFRLASKAPAIGYCHFDKSEVSQKVSDGTLEYSRTVSRIGIKAFLRYPSDYVASIFPKCYRFGKLDFPGILAVYERLWREVVFFGREFSDVSLRLRTELRSMDWQATFACYRYCVDKNVVPFTYVTDLLDYYYFKDMYTLECFYKMQVENDVKEDWHYYVLLYNNLRDVVTKAFHNVGRFRLVLYYFLEGFGIDIDFDVFMSVDFYTFTSKRCSEYRLEVEGIIKGMVKTAKMNELSGIAPTCFTT